MILVAKIVTTHGVRGEVKAQFYADSADFFGEIGNLYDKSGTEYKIVSSRPQKGAVLLRFDGIDSIEQAEKLRGRELFVKKEDLPAPEEGRYYIDDLIGLRTVTDSGEYIGEIKDVLSYANDIFEIKRNSGETALVPFVDEFVKEVSLERGEVVIIPMEGLLDEI